MVWILRTPADEWTVTEDGWSYVLRRGGREIGRYSNATKAKRAAEALIAQPRPSS